MIKKEGNKNQLFDKLPRLLSPKEVAAVFGVSLKFVRERIYTGEIPSYKMGRLRRMYARDVEAWLSRQQGG
jgi:excisionase family DNA binding protein